jgi:peptidoglycan glycosyltransferase
VNSRGKILYVLFFAAVVIVSLFMIDRMVLQRDSILRLRYTDEKFISLMEELVSSGVFGIEGDEVVIDETAFSGKHLSRKTEERIRRSVHLLQVKRNTISVDRNAFSIAHTRESGREIVLRGRFLDRNGTVLAESISDDKTGKINRIYNYGPEFFHIIGHDNVIYRKRNLEKVLDDYLCGRRHEPVFMETSDPLKKFMKGDDVFLTIDSHLQRYAYGLMTGKKGAVVVLDVRTGEILTAVSTPSFDPNTPMGNEWREAFGDGHERPYVNRAFSSLYSPGSTFKVVVASAWLDGRETGAEKKHHISCDGQINRYGISDLYPHGYTNLEIALVESCNLYFSEIGVRLGSSILASSEAFGFNRPVSLIPQLKGRGYGAETSLAFSHRTVRTGIRKYDQVDFIRNPRLVAQGAIGQNLVSATPLQMAIIAAAIANRGVVLNPYIVKEIRTGDGGRTDFSAKTVVVGKAVSASTAGKIRGLMARVMEKGTGKKVKKIYFEAGRYTTSPSTGKTKAVRVAGKTGTAEVGDRNNNGIADPNEIAHSWFIGFAPADHPKVAVAAVAENEGFGSLTAAPIAMDVLAEALNRVRD